MAGGLNTAHEEERRVTRNQWERRFQTITLEQYNAGKEVDMRGPPDMKEYVGGNVGRGPRPVKEPTPKYRPVPEENWQKPLNQVREGESRWTGTPPQGGGDKRVRRGPRRGNG